MNHDKEKLFRFQHDTERKCDIVATFSKDYFAADVGRSKCLHATSSNALFCTHYVGNVICHKFAHGDVSYRFNGKNVTNHHPAGDVTRVSVMPRKVTVKIGDAENRCR